MSIVRVGNHVIDARPHVEAAMDALGTIRRDQREACLTAFVEIFQQGGTGHDMRRRGTPMEYRGTRMTHEAYAMLNAKGRRSPVAAFDDLVTQASLGISREGDLADHDQHEARENSFGRVHAVKLITLPGQDCAAVKPLAGAIFEWKDAPALPLEGCTEGQPFCACSWRGLMRDEKAAWLASEGR